ncbi:pyridoxamine 5'-phosphate oxidase [Jatrophihabitans sp. DSM 45814]
MNNAPGSDGAGTAPRDLATVRRSYQAGDLTEDSLAPSWLEQLQRWYDEAAAHPAITDPNAMQLATVERDGSADVRTVLARSFDQTGIVFYTNYNSAKGRQLALRPTAAAVFAWLPLERQARFRGEVSKVSAAETEAYFASRPRDAQIGAWSSPQSEVIAGRHVLDQRLAAYTARFKGRDVPPPPDWGGYRIAVSEIEFWQGRPFRLHDRLRYRRVVTATAAHGERWIVERLAP